MYSPGGWGLCTQEGAKASYPRYIQERPAYRTAGLLYCIGSRDEAVAPLLAEKITKKSHSRQSACARWGVVLCNTLIGGSICASLCANAPSSGGYLRDGECRAATSSNWRDANSLPAGRSLKAVSFPGSFRQRRKNFARSKEILKKEIIDLI